MAQDDPRETLREAREARDKNRADRTELARQIDVLEATDVDLIEALDALNEEVSAQERAIQIARTAVANAVAAEMAIQDRIQFTLDEAERLRSMTQDRVIAAYVAPRTDSLDEQDLTRQARRDALFRYVDLDGGTVWSFAVPGPSAVEGLPSGDVLVHQWETETAWRVDRHGFATWQGPWATTSGRPDGAGMQFARATPDADPDGDGFTNDEEINCGSDPGDARSAPFAVWRSGSVLHLAAADPAAVSYVVVASTDVVAGTSPLLCAATPLLHASLTPGVCFTAPYGALVGGRADLLLLPGLPADPWIAAAVYRSGWTPLHTLWARPRSQW